MDGLGTRLPRSYESHYDELSTRQAEKLVELRDDAVEYAQVGGFRVKTLIDNCWLNPS
jgi:hypothetical protein